VTFVGKSLRTLGWRYSISEAPAEPANHPPANRRRDRLEFLSSAATFGTWEIPYHAITSAKLFAPGTPLQILRVTTTADVFEFVVGRGKLPADLPFAVTPQVASPKGEFAGGLRRVRAIVCALAVVTLAALLWFLKHLARRW
jgi:hypothetical protein